MVVGVAVGKLAPGLTAALRALKFREGSRINVPIAILTWLIVYPMMLKLDLGSLLAVGRRPDCLEFDSTINLRPSFGDRSRGVDDPATRGRIADLVRELVRR